MTDAGSLGRRIAASAAWSVLLRLAVRGLGLISTLILARLLLPADFGLVAMATVAIAILEFVFDFSFSQVLIRERSDDRSLYDTVWTLSVMRGITVGALIAGGAQLAAGFYGDYRLVPVFFYLAISTVIAGFENVGTVDFRKKLQFQLEFRYRASIKLVAFVVTITLAFSLRNYWALVWGTLANQVALVVLSFYFSAYRPRFDLSQTRRIFGISVWYLLASIFGALLTRSPALTLGRLSGPESVGYFELGREVADLPTTELVWPIARTLFPGYAAAAGDMAATRKLFLASMAITMALAIPLALGIAATADLVVRIAFGPNWLPAIPVIEIMALSGLVRLSYTGSDSIVTVFGRPSLCAQLAFVSCLVTVPPMAFGAVKAGLSGAALGYLSGIILSAFVYQMSALRILDLSLAQFWAACLRSIFAGVVMYGAVTFLITDLVPRTTEMSGHLSTAMLAVVVGAFVYLAALVGSWRLAGSPPGGEQMILNELRMRLQRRR